MHIINLGDSIKTNVEGMDIHYDCIGKGYPIILLHGWGANRNTFNRMAKDLSDRFKVYCIDLPGFGDSEIGLPLNLFEVTDVIYHFCVNLNIDRPIVIGHSYGGRIACIYASKYPVKKLILISSAGIRQKLSFKKRVNVRIYKLLKKLNINVRMGSKDYLDCDNVKRRMLVDAVNTDLTEYMNKINTECLLIYGKKDETTPVELGRIIESSIKNSALVEMDNCGHFPYLEQPTIFQLILDSFLVSDAL